MIDFGEFKFASPPCTGTTWFMQVAAMAGFGESFKAHVHTPPEHDYPHSLVYCVVRHPASWLASYYHAIKGGSVGVASIDKFAPYAREARDVEDFVASVVLNLPGGVGGMFEVYCSSNVMRLEDQPDAALELFRMLGVSRDRLATIKDTPPANVSRGYQPLSQKIRSAVCEVERDFCDLYEYGDW